MDSISLETKLVGKIKGDFYIPAYQRGYRWKEEVKMLLDDIDNVPEGQNYSLQPLVVKAHHESNKYELIDGQQRLTTLFLIYKYMIHLRLPFKLSFSLEYETRKGSKQFMDDIDSIDLSIEPKNIDEYYLIEAYKIISSWFRSQEDESLAAFNLYKKFNERIRVIWYEVNTDEDSVSLFTRLNIGRIPLTNSELVKALFLSRDNCIDEKKQLEIATAWDIIEKELHDKRFWYFITNENAEKYPTKIELIFNLMADKKPGEREKYYTFFHFASEIEQKDNKADVWTGIQRYYQRLKEWYENTDLYHKIGYLIASESTKLKELIEYSRNTTKTAFQESLDHLIAESIDFKKDYSDLSYENALDYGLIEKLLLLFNVETIRQKADETMRFPFDKHKQENWSLEHIHAQQSEGLNKREQWMEWLELHKESLFNIDRNGHAGLLDQIDQALADKKLTGEKFLALFEKVTQVLSENGSIEQTHSLSNLSLLSSSDNSALSNSTFDVKRNRILKMDKSSDYIPECTRRVFLKYYTPSENNQMHFWGKADREGYVEAMNVLLRHYLSLIEKLITT